MSNGTPSNNRNDRPNLYELINSESESSLSDNSKQPSPKIKISRMLAQEMKRTLTMIRSISQADELCECSNSFMLGRLVGLEMDTIEDPEIYKDLKYQIVDKLFTATFRDRMLKDERGTPLRSNQTLSKLNS